MTSVLRYLKPSLWKRSSTCLRTAASPQNLTFHCSTSAYLPDSVRTLQTKPVNRFRDSEGKHVRVSPGSRVAQVCVPEEDEELDDSWSCVTTGWGTTMTKGNTKLGKNYEVPQPPPALGQNSELAGVFRLKIKLAGSFRELKQKKLFKWNKESTKAQGLQNRSEARTRELLSESSK